MIRISIKLFIGHLRFQLVPTTQVDELGNYQRKKEVQKEGYLSKCNKQSKSNVEWTTQWILGLFLTTWLILFRLSKTRLTWVWMIIQLKIKILSSLVWMVKMINQSSQVLWTKIFQLWTITTGLINRVFSL